MNRFVPVINLSTHNTVSCQMCCRLDDGGDLLHGVCMREAVIVECDKGERL